MSTQKYRELLQKQSTGTGAPRTELEQDAEWKSERTKTVAPRCVSEVKTRTTVQHILEGNIQIYSYEPNTLEQLPASG